MSDVRRLQLSIFASLLINAAALLALSWFWRWEPVPVSAVYPPHIKLVRVALRPPPPPLPVPPPPVPAAKPTPRPVPKTHHARPKPLPKHRRPGAKVKTSSPAPLAQLAGGSDAGASASQTPAASPAPAAPPVHVEASQRPSLLVIHNSPLPLPPLPTPSFTPGVIAAQPVPKPVPKPVLTAQAGHGASGADTAGRGHGAGEGSGTGSGIGAGSSQDAGEPFGVGKGLAGDGGPRHIVYVLDISGSMTSRIKRADAELRKAITGLGPDETFDIIAFNNEVYTFDSELAPATPSAVKRASEFLDTLVVNDGTNTQAGMRAALSIPDVNEVVLLTDGMPGQGITDTDSLTEYIRHINKNHARISCVGMVGTDQDGVDRTFEGSSLLQHIARDSGGACEIIPLGYKTNN